MTALDIRIDPSVAPKLALGVLVLGAVRRPDEASAERFDLLLASLVADLRAGPGADPRAKERFVASARALYRRFGIDPTRYRPSSEALLRRILKGEGFPRISPLVDAVNLCQLQERLPYGLYDMAALAPPIVARAGREGERYEGIRKASVNLAGKPALFDERGPFGNPSSDSDRAKTTEETTGALVVIFGAAETPRSQWEGRLGRTEAVVRLRVPCEVVERRVVEGEAP